MGTALVTGAAGLLGAAVALTLRERGVPVVAAYRRPEPRLAGVPARVGDLADPRFVLDLLNEVRPDWVVHCAALTSVDRCEDHPQEARRANVQAAGTLAGACAASGRRLLYVSTDSVFDGEAGGYAETDPVAPLNEYARSKWLGEEEVRAASPSHLVVRTNLFGWNLQPKLSLAEWILERLSAGEPLSGFEDVHFNPLLANDLAGVLLEAMERSLAGVYHAGASDSVSKYEFGRMLAREFGLDESLVRRSRLAAASLRAPRPRNTTLRTERLERALGRRLPTVGEGVARFRELRDGGFVDLLRTQPQGANDGAV